MKPSRTIAVMLAAILLPGCFATAPVHEEARRLNGQGAAALRGGELDRAEVLFRLSLEYTPCFGDALHNLALVHLLRNELPSAERREEEALACRPDLVQAICGLGSVRLAQGDLEEALRLFERAVELDPGYLDGRRNWILALLKTGQRTQALAQLEKLRALSPDDPLLGEVAKGPDGSGR